MSPFLQTIPTAVTVVIVQGMLLFIPAGTLAYWPGWVFIVVVAGASNAISLYLAIKDPETLARRMKGGPAEETRPIQRVLVCSIFIVPAAALVVSALDWRLVWSNAPIWVIVLGNALVAFGIYLTFLVLQQNRYAAATVETSQGQTVISTGLYGFVRHPMYLGGLISYAGTPLALGSYCGLLVIVVMIPVLMLRITDEEKMLVDELKGYEDYRHKVKFRLIPAIW